MEGLFVGLMSGTSVDSIDAVIVNLSKDRFELVEEESTPIQNDLKNRIFEAVNDSHTSKNNINDLDIELGKVFGKATLHLLDKASIDKSNIVAIGSHGQTIKHEPNLPNPYSLQIGNPKEIIRITNIRTVADFRKADIQAGGQGAPLSPLFHQFIFKISSISEGTVINIGGISNLTSLKNSSEEIIAYDSGPGNCLIDVWNKNHKKGDFDEDGSWASSGKCIPQLLQTMINDPFFKSSPPKSTGADYFNLRWIEKNLLLFKEEFLPQDVQATLAELTVKTIYAELKRLNVIEKNVYICGGGIYNTFLIQRLEKMIKNKTFSTLSLGIDPDYVEASCFAWLAKERLNKRSFDLSKITGSNKKVLLGKVWKTA